MGPRSRSPKRALLSLKSMMVMCVVMSLFVWDILARYRAWSGALQLWDESVLDRVELWLTNDPLYDGSTTLLLLNLAVALAVSVALALASERFVFRKLRRSSTPEAKEEPK